MGKQLHCGVSRTSHPCCLLKMRFPSLREHISREKSVRTPLCVFISNLPPVEDTWQTASAPSALIVASDGCPGAKWALFSTDPSPSAPPRGLQRFFKWLKNRFWSSSVTMLCNNSSVIICYHYLICHITPSPDKKKSVHCTVQGIFSISIQVLKHLDSWYSLSFEIIDVRTSYK